MPTEGAQFPTELNANNPSPGASAGEGDDELRQLKFVIQSTLAGQAGDLFDKALTAGPTFLNSLVADFPDISDNAMRKDIAGTVAVEHIFSAGMKINRGTNIQSDNDAQVIGVGASDEIVVGSGTAVSLSDSSGSPTVNDGVSSSPILTQKNVADLIFPVGAIYLTAGNANPVSQFPGTSWTQVSKGRFLVGVGAGTDKNGEVRTYSAGNDAVGEYKHRLTVSEMPAHNHSILSGVRQVVEDKNQGISVAAKDTGQVTGTTGGGGLHENSPPAFAVYVWQRTG